MARTREVFPTSEIPHKWAHQTQENARNPQGNLYFKGATIYSYHDSWPLARIYKRKVAGAVFEKDNPAVNLVLVNCDTYSTTTNGHASDVRQAIRHLPSLSVPVVENRYSYGNNRDAKLSKDEHAANLAYLEKTAAEHLSKAQRAMQVSSVNRRRGDARALLEGYAHYMAFFGIRRKVPAFPNGAWAAAEARAQRIESPSPEEIARREKSSAARAAMADDVTEYRREMARSMESAGHYLGYRAQRGKNWPATLARLTGEKGRPWYAEACGRTAWRLGEYNGHGTGDSVMLRINGEQIETSQGARIPLAAAPMVWNLVQRAIRNGGYEPSGLGGMKIGDYALDSIGADGTLKVGCHVIPYSELRSMARQLNLAAA